jgi:hypothetical protein
MTAGDNAQHGLAPTVGRLRPPRALVGVDMDGYRHAPLEVVDAHGHRA